MDGVNYHDEMCKRMMNSNYGQNKQNEVLQFLIPKYKKLVNELTYKECTNDYRQGLFDAIEVLNNILKNDFKGAE